MKTTYTDQELQAAIDAAGAITCEKAELPSGLLYIDSKKATFPLEEANARLILAKTFLEKLEEDPYAELKKAHAEGRVIEHRTFPCTWAVCEKPSWAFSPDFYRIKPEPDTFEAPQTNPVPDQTQVAWTPAVGDVVRLKSGGPMMTVHYVKDDNAVGCVTFSNQYGFAFSTLSTACLIKEDAQ